MQCEPVARGSSMHSPTQSMVSEGHMYAYNIPVFPTTYIQTPKHHTPRLCKDNN
jgi:hypothetical protein